MAVNGKFYVQLHQPPIIRMFNNTFDGVGALAGDYYPGAVHGKIDALNERVYQPHCLAG